MSSDDLIARLDERLKQFEISRRPELILGSEIKAEATELLAATRISGDSPSPTRDDAMRMMLARHHVSRLYFLRSFESHPEGDPAELAAAVLMSAWLGEMVPELLLPEVRVLVGLTPPTGSGSDFATTITGVLQAASMTSGDPQVLDAAVLTLRARLAEPGGDPDGRVASCLCVAYRSRFMRRGDPKDLDLAIKQGVRAFEAAADDEERMSRAANLCACYRERFDLSDADTDLDRAVSLGEQAVGLVPGGHPIPQVLVNLSTAYFRRFTHRGADHAALDRCIELGEQAMAAAGGVPAPVLSNTGMAYRERFLLHGRVDDLERAVELTTRAVAESPGADPDRAMSLANAAVVLRQRFGRFGEVADLQRAIDLTGQAIAGMPDHQTNPARANLANMYHELYGRTGEVGALSRAADAGEDVLARMPPGHPDRGTHSANLSVVYQQRFRRLGNRSDLDRAIELGDQALAGPGWHSPSIPQAVGLAHLERYLLHGVTGDLGRSIELAQRSVDETPAGHVERPTRLLDAAIGYFERFRRRGAETDLTRAIAMGEEALGAIPGDRPGRAQHLAELSLAYLARFHLEPGDQPADRAVGLAADAEAALAADDPDLAGILGLRCLAHQARFWLRHRRSDLDEAIAAGERALELSGPDAPRLADQLANIAVAYVSRIDHFRHAITPDRLAWLCEQASGAGSAQPVERLRACWRVGALALAMGRPESAVPLLDQAVDLLPSTAPREGDWADQEHRLGGQPDLVSQAVAAHCAAGDPGGALVVAEAGRAVLLTNQIRSRTDLSELRSAAPETARRLEDVWRELNARQPHEGRPEHPARADERRALWAEQDRLLNDVRADPRFTDFLRPDPLGHDRPPTGAVILVSAGPARGDAVILRPTGDPEHVALEGFTGVAALAAVQLVRQAGDVGKVLGWLWDTVVEPVLAVAAPVDGGKSRIWWLPVGPIGSLPFHAAGHPGRPGALHRVVSSYAPTLQSLAYSRARPAAGTRRQLAVGPVRAPGDTDLPAARLEVADLSARTPGTRSLIDDDARVEDVLRALPEATWVHFACHAAADPVAPSRSSLRLHEGELPVARIGRLDLTSADLAYLSACSTMDAWSRPADESLHLAAAFQLAGFRHVVATLWPLNDALARRAARMFYDRVTDADRAAETLNQVTLELRDSLPNHPEAWATLVHSGP